jgi:N-acetylmuramoyl-L-alanine amidase
MATGEEIIELAANHIGEKYILGAFAPKNNANYKGPWDCAEFVSWCIFQVSGLKVGMRNDDAYTGYWQEDMVTKYSVLKVFMYIGF